MRKRNFTFILTVFLSASGCIKEKKYEYLVDPVTVSNNPKDKTRAKSTIEFISIAYSDLYGVSIPQNKLINLSTAYSSFGDLKIIEDRIIRNLINDSLVHIPAVPAINGDTVKFIQACYRKFYNRDPDEYEKYFLQNEIRKSSLVTPALIYYSLMTSDEYRFY